MMLVEHDVEAELIGELPLIVVAVKQICSDVRIAVAVEEIDPQRARMLVPTREIRLLGELIDSHCATSCLTSHLVFANANTFSAKTCGCSSWGKCPARSISSNRAPGIIPA